MLGHKHPFSSAAATNLAVTLRLLLGMVDQAHALNEQALTDMREPLGVDHPFTLVCATNLVSDLAALDQADAAHVLDQETLERSNWALGANHPSSLALQVNLALDLPGLNWNDEAATMQHRNRRTLGGDAPREDLGGQRYPRQLLRPISADRIPALTAVVDRRPRVLYVTALESLIDSGTSSSFKVD